MKRMPALCNDGDAAVPTNRRRLLKALALASLTAALPPGARADEEFDRIRQRGRLRIAVYESFPPYSGMTEAGKGIDAELGRALAGKLGLQPDLIPFPAGEDMGDDLRNMVWKGHYLRGEAADVLMHVPVDPLFAEANDKVRIFGKYHHEALALARRKGSRVPLPIGSAAIALEVFTREKIGVEGDTLADSFLLGVMHGRLRGNVVHFRSVGEAVKALADDRIAAVLAPAGELEGATHGDERIVVDVAAYGELKRGRWPLGMAVKAEATDLAAALDRALGELRANGTVAGIFARHGVTLRES